MALTFVGSASYAATSGALPAFNAGDIALVFAYRDGSNTAPTLPAGWTNLNGSGANTNSARTGYRVLQAGDTTTSVWTSATEIQVLVLRGQHASPIGGGAAGGTASNQISYTGFAFVDSGTPQGASWVVGFAGSRSATDVNTKAVTGMTTRSGSVVTLGAHTAQDVGSFASANYTTTVSSSLGWRSNAVEIRAAVAEKVTGTARISLQAGQPPLTRTSHVILVRGRVTVFNDEVFRVQLYEGATPRSVVLQTGVLSASLTDYALAVADSDAAAIGSYADLEVRVWGASPGGHATTFEVAQVSLSLPGSASGTQYGATVAPFVVDIVTQGNSASAGVKQTGQARISLAPGFVPVTRTNHVITVRARRTALQGKLRVQLFENTTPRSAVLETSELTTSLAAYTLNVADADAATIVDYQALELRIWGYSSTGTATAFEVADVSLALPQSTTGGTVVGAAVIQSISSVSAGASAVTVIYPGGGVFPQNFAHLLSTSTITGAGVREQHGNVVLPLVATRITSGDTSLTNRTGQVLIASTSAVTVVGTPVYLGKVLIASVSTVSAGSSQSVTGLVTIASTSSVSATAYVPAVPPPATYVVHALSGMPAYMVGIAFTSDPLDPIQNFSGVTPYVREMAERRGRQFELDRIEAGESDFILSNNDGRFSPENTGGPYYPNVTATRRIRWRAFWSAVEYDLFNGFLEGYPQEFPSQGKDSLVRQHAVDGFMALAVAKFVPGSTVLTSDMVATTEQTSEIIGVASTALPMPQSAPFVITIEAETLSVTEIVSGTQYRVDRVQGSSAHAAGSSVLTTAVSFGTEYTGTRIRNVLERVGIPPAEMDLEAGQTLLAPSEDLATQAPTEHLQFVAEVEGGVFFNSAGNKWTFYDRHHVFKNETSARATFGDGAGELPYHEVEVTHDDKKIVNLIRITTASGHVAEVRDQASINEHFERPLEKQWPLANDNDAEAAAHYLLYRYSAMQIRVPRLQVMGRANPSSMWPIVLGLETGQRYRVIRRGAGTAIDKQLIVEGVSRTADKSNLVTDVQLSLADTRHYWRVNISGYGELGQTTTVAY